MGLPAAGLACMYTLRGDHSFGRVLLEWLATSDTSEDLRTEATYCNCNCAAWCGLAECHALGVCGLHGPQASAHSVGSMCSALVEGQCVISTILDLACHSIMCRHTVCGRFSSVLGTHVCTFTHVNKCLLWSDW